MNEQAKMAEKIQALVKAADDVLRAVPNSRWNEIAAHDYPSYLPSFDEFLLDLIQWRDSVKEAPDGNA